MQLCYSIKLQNLLQYLACISREKACKHFLTHYSIDVLQSALLMSPMKRLGYGLLIVIHYLVNTILSVSNLYICSCVPERELYS